MTEPSRERRSKWGDQAQGPAGAQPPTQPTAAAATYAQPPPSLPPSASAYGVPQPAPQAAAAYAQQYAAQQYAALQYAQQYATQQTVAQPHYAAPPQPYAPPPPHPTLLPQPKPPPPVPATGFVPAPGGVGRVFVPPQQVAKVPAPPPSGSGFAAGPGGVGRVFFPPAGGRAAGAAEAGGEPGSSEAKPQGKRRFREEDEAEPAPKPRRSFREEEDEPPKPARRRFTEDEEEGEGAAAPREGGAETVGASGAAGGTARRAFREEEEAEEAVAPKPSLVTLPAAAKPPAEDDLAKWGLLPNAPPPAALLPVGGVRGAAQPNPLSDGSERAGLGSGGVSPLALGAGVGPDAPAPRLGGLNRYLPLSELARLTAQPQQQQGDAHAAESAGGSGTAAGERLESSNVGHQMLCRMGWSEGRGLQPGSAAEREGIAEPISGGELLKRGERPGLGLGECAAHRRHAPPVRAPPCCARALGERGRGTCSAPVSAF